MLLITLSTAEEKSRFYPVDAAIQPNLFEINAYIAFSLTKVNVIP